MDKDKEHWTKDYIIRGFGFRRGHMVTDEDDVIDGLSLLLFGKVTLTVAYANTPWVDENDKPYKFRYEKGLLFIHKLAIGMF